MQLRSGFGHSWPTRSQRQRLEGTPKKLLGWPPLSGDGPPASESKNWTTHAHLREHSAGLCGGTCNGAGAGF